MIPTPLLRVSTRKGVLVPRFVDAADADQLERAARIGERVEAAVARKARFGELADELDEAAEGEEDLKLWKGLCHLALERTTTANQAPLDPSELRGALFRAAAATGPLGPPGAERNAERFVAGWAAERGLRTEDVWGSLYADLPSEATLEGTPPVDPVRLLHRYNLALVQGLLRDAVELRIALVRPSAPRMRQLFRWVKFHQLLHRAHRDGDTLTLTLDGPVSLFSASTRYGRALANFLPALVLHEEPWTLEATVAWTRKRVHRLVKVSRDDGLVSHLPDTGAWRSKAVEQFSRRFADEGGAFTLADGERPLSLGRGAVVFPDFTLRDGKRVAHLEVLGHWRTAWLTDHLARIERDGPANLVVAASRKLCGDKAAEPPDHPRLVWYADVLPIAQVRARVEAFATEG